MFQFCPSHALAHLLLRAALAVAVGAATPASHGQTNPDPNAGVKAAVPTPLEVDLTVTPGQSSDHNFVDLQLMQRWLKGNAQLWQFLNPTTNQPALSRAEFDDLLVRSEKNIATLLQTRGYFNSSVHIKPEAVPAQVTVELGPLTTIRAISVEVVDNNGAVLDALTASTNEAWGLKPGATFTQSAWQSAKDKALARLSANTYYQASIAHSLARIDPTTQQATLQLRINSGPAFVFGSSTVLGSARYDTNDVLNLAQLAGIRQGQPYAAQALFDAQRRIIDNGNYSSAFITLGPQQASGPGQPDQLNARIEVNEKPLKLLETSIGISTDSGPRLHITHTHYRTPFIGWQAVHSLDWQKDAQTLSSNWLSPLDERAWQWTGGLELERQKDDDITTKTQQWRAGQMQSVGDIERTYYLQLINATEQVQKQTPRTTSTLSAHWAWSTTRWDNASDPTSGHGLSFDLGAGTTLTQGAKPYLRAQTQWLTLHPFDNAKLGRMAFRAALGGVLANEDTAVPASELFLTGGDTSVRGYAARSIGRTDNAATSQGLILPGRFMWLGGVEWQRPTTWGGDVGRVEQTFFVDASAVSNRIDEQHVFVGTGTGVRFVSPVGPMQLDLAYGHHTKEWRLHLFVGIRF